MQRKILVNKGAAKILQDNLQIERKKLKSSIGLIERYVGPHFHEFFIGNKVSLDSLQGNKIL